MRGQTCIVIWVFQKWQHVSQNKEIKGILTLLHERTVNAPEDGTELQFFVRFFFLFATFVIAWTYLNAKQQKYINVTEFQQNLFSLPDVGNRPVLQQKPKREQRKTCKNLTQNNFKKNYFVNI